LQTYTLLRIAGDGGTVRKSAVGSLVVSALTVGFSAATISFDLDVNPRRRRDEPGFYGYVPDSAGRRTLVFGCMILIGTFLLLIRSVSAALLALVKPQYVVWYYLGDMTVYFLYKAVRRDLWWWAPFDGVAGVIGSLMVRLSLKSLVDHTACFHFRNPTDLGGLFYTANMAVALAVSLAATQIYVSSDTGEGGGMGEVVWKIVGGLSGGLVLAYVDSAQRGERVRATRAQKPASGLLCERSERGQLRGLPARAARARRERSEREGQLLGSLRPSTH
jgi:hypothetical protein